MAITVNTAVLYVSLSSLHDGPSHTAAKNGNSNAMKLVIERIVPPQTARRVSFR
jgi:hypothetical protein